MEVGQEVDEARCRENTGWLYSFDGGVIGASCGGTWTSSTVCTGQKGYNILLFL